MVSTIKNTKDDVPSATVTVVDPPAAAEPPVAQPVFRCEICNITFRSQGKLEDHVKYSPLHQSLIAKRASTPVVEKPMIMEAIPDPPPSAELIYDGMKLFWRINKTLRINIFRDPGTNVGTVIGVEDDTDKATPAIYVDLAKVEQSVRKAKGLAKDDTKINLKMPMANFILERLGAEKTEENKVIVTLKTLYDDLFDSISIVKSTGNVVVSKRRRHSFEDAMNLQSLLDKETKQLTAERMIAGNMVSSTRRALGSMEELSFNIKKKADASPAKSKWLNSFNKLKTKASVLQTKARLDGNTDLMKKLETQSNAMKAAMGNIVLS